MNQVRRISYMRRTSLFGDNHHTIAFPVHWENPQKNAVPFWASH